MAVSEERLRRDLEHLAPPGDPSGVVERVLRRVARRRRLRGVQAAGVVLVVVGGTMAGTYGLTKAFRPTIRLPAAMRSVAEAGEAAPSSTPTSLTIAGGALSACGVSTVPGDFFGDGVADTAYVFVVTSLPTCGASAQDPTMIGVQPEAHGAISVTFGPIDCPGGCRALAAADIDGDGRAEIAVVAGADGSSQVLTLYRVVEAPPTGGDPTIEQVRVAGSSDVATLGAASGGADPSAADISCPPGGRPLAPEDVASIGSLVERYRSWLGRGNHTSGVKAGQDPALLSRIATVALQEGLGGEAIQGIFRPSFSWGLNDPNGGGGLLRFLLRSPDLLARVVRFQAEYEPEASNPYFAMNPGAVYQSAMLREFPELHAAYSVMAEGDRPFAEFWETEGNLLPLATIAWRNDPLGRRAADVLASLQAGLEQVPDRDYFFVGGAYSGPRSVFSLRSDLAAFVRSWSPSERSQTAGSCVTSA